MTDFQALIRLLAENEVQFIIEPDRKQFDSQVAFEIKATPLKLE
ncbi:MAG TPA: hypothetical protein VI750_13750 [Pyrinomonadaceae bacterium]|nr:hypothetical protein [Pyrinomonadaceae bacterium]